MNMAGKLMKAVWYNSYGGGSAGLKHVEIPIPSPGVNEILLKIEAASINPIDWKIQKGMVRPFLPKKFPVIPAGDVAGEIVEVGSGVKKFKAGDKIVSTLGAAGGGFAEYAVAKENLTVSRPPEVSAADGASLVIAGCTALHALTITGGINLVKIQPRSNILITAASGGVGHYAVQLAKLGNTHDSRSPNGKVIDLTPSGGAFWTYAVKKITFSKKQLQPLLVVPKAEQIECLLNYVKEGKLKTVIDSRYPLSRAEEAWEKSIEGHATGKVVVEP
ncbi:unnamed protein product [Lactuca virosa]|uniref:Enoyl reductase (ER) domain-containing protein n=1 Tax=Lactuca virosa TaxID=75947 RepID=A0AAU9PLY2_9ASTR|nr:unnamed protein product [Lactuca virosa]